MEALLTGLIILVLIFFFLGIGTWVFAGLLLVSVTGLWLILDFNRTGSASSRRRSCGATRAPGSSRRSRCSCGWARSSSAPTSPTGCSAGLAPLVDKVPGRLLHTNVLGCTLFAAVSGSSAATTATVGKITTTELDRRGYDVNLTIGSLAGAGSLGLLIPPSIVMIIYGILAEVSVARLFAAGVLPGLLIAGLYSAYIMCRCAIAPGLSPSGASATPSPSVSPGWSTWCRC